MTIYEFSLHIKLKCKTFLPTLHFISSSRSNYTLKKSFRILTWWIQGPEWWSTVISGLSVTLRSYKLRVSGPEVICGLHNVRQKQGRAVQEAPGAMLHHHHHRRHSSISRFLVIRSLCLQSAGLEGPAHLWGVQVSPGGRRFQGTPKGGAWPAGRIN